MNHRSDHSPTPRRGTPKRGSTHARMRGDRSAGRGSGYLAESRRKRAVASLDRWQLEHAETPADPLDAFAAYADWIRAEVKLARRLWGNEGSAETTAAMADTMHKWALQIDEQIRAALGVSS